MGLEKTSVEPALALLRRWTSRAIFVFENHQAKDRALFFGEANKEKDRRVECGNLDEVVTREPCEGAPPDS